MKSLSLKFKNAKVKGVFLSSPEPKTQVSYCQSAPSVVRLSVRPSVNFSHFPLLLQNRSMDFDENGDEVLVPLQVLLFIGQIRPWADPGRGQIGHVGFRSSKNFSFRPEGYSNKRNA